MTIKKKSPLIEAVVIHCFVIRCVSVFLALTLSRLVSGIVTISNYQFKLIFKFVDSRDPLPLGINLFTFIDFGI